MKPRLLAFSIILLTSFQINGQENNESYPDLTSKIDSIIIESKFNGVVSVSIDSSNIYYEAIGFSDLENKTQIRFSDQFVIGSISKQITAVLILHEFEKGNLDLDDKINRYLKEINQPWSKKVTVHHLLTHTHGILDIEKPLEFEEGSQFKYSQLGYELLAQILQKVTGKTFEQISTELFEKNGLKNTFHPKNRKYKHLVKGYEENINDTLVFATNSLDNYVPAGSFISNAEDLKRWNQKLYSGQLVSHQTLELMSTRFATRIHPIFEKVEYGYGLLFKEGEQGIQIGALGYSPGFVSACYWYPQSKTNVIILGNIARELNDFKKTFQIHTEIMDAVKKRTLINGCR